MNAFRAILIFGVRVYRFTLSPLKSALIGPAARCRFQPSCSEYAIQALQIHGPFAGSWLSMKRLCRCHPWGGCGVDPVPSKTSSTDGNRNCPTISFSQSISREQAPASKDTSLTLW